MLPRTLPNAKNAAPLPPAAGASAMSALTAEERGLWISGLTADVVEAQWPDGEGWLAARVECVNAARVECVNVNGSFVVVSYTECHCSALNIESLN